MQALDEDHISKLKDVYMNKYKPILNKEKLKHDHIHLMLNKDGMIYLSQH